MKIKILSGIAVLTIILVLSACETINEEPYSSSSIPSDMAYFSVNIVSDPAGAIIEINDNYIGKTPMTVELEGWKATRTFVRRHSIVASSEQPGEQTQHKYFMGWPEPSRTYGDPIPENIYFNMDY